MAEKIIEIQNADIFYLNFSGKPDKYNKDGGKRSFCCEIDYDTACTLKEAGWTGIKLREPREEGDDPSAYIRIALRFDVYPPKIRQITSNGMRKITETTVDNLDWAEIERVDLSFRGYNWSRDETPKIKAYLVEMYVTLYESNLAKKYAHLDDLDDSLPFDSDAC